MSRVCRLRRLLLTSLCAAIGGVGVFSSLDCTESDGPSPSPIPVRSFNLADSVYTIVEADTSVYVRVERSCGCDSAWVWVACSTGTASAGEDYIATTAKLGFDPGSVAESLAVPILSDTLSEPSEIVLVTLGPASGTYAIEDPDTGRLTIEDDDSTTAAVQRVAFDQTVWMVSESAGQVELLVRRTATGDTASVGLRTVGAGAAALQDYVPLALTLHFASGDSALRPSLEILQDSLSEGPETLRVVLENPSANCELGAPDTARVVILDDESRRPVFAFTQAHYFAFEGQPARVTITCTDLGNPTNIVHVVCSTRDGTAHAGTDYITQARSLLFGGGFSYTQMEFEVDLIDNHAIGFSKEFTVQLSKPSDGCLVAPPGTAIVEILDEDTPMEPPTLAFPLEAGNQWIFDAVTTRQSGDQDPIVLYETLTGSLGEQVRYRGRDYVSLSLVPSAGSSSERILLRQSGDSLHFICPTDTLPAEPGTWGAQLQETLPWVLVDLSTVTDTTVTLFSRGSDHWTGFDRRTLHVFGRENTVVPAGQFRETLHVKYERASAPGQVGTGSTSFLEFTLADSVGFVRVGYGSFRYGQTDPEEFVCRAELVSCSFGE